MASTPKFDLRFLVRMDKSHTGEYGKFTARVVFVDEEGKVRHPSSTWSGSFEAPYADLTVTAQCNRRPSGDDNQRWYAVEFGYTDSTHAVDLRRAEMMVKTLRRVQAKLDKLSQEHGWSEDLGVVLTRVATALGIKLYAMSDSYTGDKYGQPKVEDYRWTDATGILYAMETGHRVLLGV